MLKRFGYWMIWCVTESSSTKSRRLITVTVTWMSRKELDVVSYSLDDVPFHSIFTTKVTQLEYPPINIKSMDLIASCDRLLYFAVNKRHAVL